MHRLVEACWIVCVEWICFAQVGRGVLGEGGKQQLLVPGKDLV